MSFELTDLCDTVKRNCDIANANHAADSTLCVYLLKMREYYRWDQGLRFDAALDENSLGRWLRAQEEYWETIETEPFRPLVVDNYRFDPFDAASVNSVLAGNGLVYSAGFGIRGAA
ncbi:MAG: hypothetical protein OET44_17400, partial [Gammaproteobacteria bacterium]|nr:hypothetical protein [Gammaproteobacteria bacterium]